MTRRLLHSLSTFTVALLALLALSPAPVWADASDDALEAMIVQRITSVILQQYNGASRENLNIDFALPSAVSSLEPCTSPPEIDASRDRWLGSVRLTLTCNDSPGWRMNVRASVDLRMPVAALNRSLPRNHVLTENDITFQDTNIANLRQGYFLDADAVTGTSLVRSLNSGQILTHRNIEVPTMIQRGDTVTILAKGGGVVVSMEGTALADGAHGRQIPVRNNSSERELRAWVVDRGLVEVPFVSRNQ